MQLHPAQCVLDIVKGSDHLRVSVRCDPSNSVFTLSECCSRFALACGEREARTQFVHYTWYPETVHRLTDLATACQASRCHEHSVGEISSLLDIDSVLKALSVAEGRCCLAEYSTPPSRYQWCS